MKLAVVGPFPPHRGGISHYGASLVHTLQKAGHEVLPIGYKKLYPSMLFPGESEIDSDLAPLQGATRHLVPWLPWTWWKARRALKRFQADLVVFELWHPFFVPVMRFLQRSAKSNVVIAHNVLPHEKQTLGKLLNPILLRAADTVLVGSKGEADQLKQLAPGVPSVIAPHPVYDRLQESGGTVSVSSVREELNVQDDHGLFAHCGLIRKYKGADLLLKAFQEANIPNAHLLIAGEFYDDEAPYRELAQQGPASARIEIRSHYLGDEEMAQYLLAADCLVLPYRHVTQSGMAMAALALGTPVLTTRVGTLGELIREGENGLLAEPEDVDGIARMLSRFADDLKAWRARREEIRKDAVSRYSWDALVEKLLGAAD